MRFYQIRLARSMTDCGARNFPVATGRTVISDSADGWPTLPLTVHSRAYTPKPPQGLPRRVLLYLLAQPDGASSRELCAAVGQGQSFATVCGMLSRHGEWFAGGSRGRPVPWRLTPAGRALAGSLERES